MSIIVRGCIGCPFHGVSGTLGGVGADHLCDAEARLALPADVRSRAALNAIQQGARAIPDEEAQLDASPEWCPLRSMAITVRRAG